MKGDLVMSEVSIEAIWSGSSLYLATYIKQRLLDTYPSLSFEIHNKREVIEIHCKTGSNTILKGECSQFERDYVAERPDDFLPRVNWARRRMRNAR